MHLGRSYALWPFYRVSSSPRRFEATFETDSAAPFLRGTCLAVAASHLGGHVHAKHSTGLDSKGPKAMNDNVEMERRGRIPSDESVRDVMTPLPRVLDASASVMDAAEIMRDSDIGDVVVLEDRQLYGILTDRDIVVRVLAEGSDPATVRVGQVCSRELTTIPPTASVGDAVRLIREKAIRRLPVVEEGEVVGIVSMGDIAVARDRKSALGDVSAAPPNT